MKYYLMISTYKEEVLLLQRRLNELIHDDQGRKLVEDGLFGKNTLAAVNSIKSKMDFGISASTKASWEYYMDICLLMEMIR